MKKILKNEKIRNIAVIAHVDHGKTTLVDHMLRQSGTFRDNQHIAERVMDNMDLEKERGITIAAKNCSVWYKNTRINIIDTPGHADFGGEVERGLKMVDGVLLLVDASEGPLPQTRFVLRKALENGLKVVVIVNKIDRKDARPKEVLDEIYALFMDLDAKDHQIEFPILYAIGREGIAQKHLKDKGKNLEPLFETILHAIPAPTYDPAEPFQMLVCDLDYSEYMGRLAIGRVFNGSIKCNQDLVCINEANDIIPLRVSELQVYNGLKITKAEEANPGDIIILAGIENVRIGDTICNKEAPKAHKRIDVDEPTLSMIFTINSSPFSGKEGKFVQSKKIGERLNRETLKNVSIRVENTADADKFLVKARGEFQMEILVETMRRESFELSVCRPHVIFKEKNGKQLEPVEHLFIDCDDSSIGIITEKISRRKGKMTNLVNHGTGRVRMEFSIPSRGLIGYRGEFLTDTRGTGIMNSILSGYEEYRGDFQARVSGSLVSDRKGMATAYALHGLEPRGILFVVPGDQIYEGMIVGEHTRENDLDVNPCREKKLTNMRAAGSDDTIKLTPVLPMSLEHAITFIREDEMVEVTPKSIRLRKAILSKNRPRN
jgi:GTP-binding protein